MAEADLRLLLKTIADTTGAEKTSAALRKVQQDATRANTQQQQSAAAMGQGLTSVAVAARAVAGPVGVAVTAFETLRRSADLVAESLGTFAESQRSTRAVAAAYGALTSDVTRFGLALGASTGFTTAAVQQSLLTVRTLSQNYALSIQQTKDVIKLSSDLASVYGFTLTDATKRVSDAIRGEAEASEQLGLTLGAVFLAERWRQAGMKGTFETASEAEKAQFRLADATRQAAQFSGLAAEGAKGLAGAQRDANRASDEFQRTLGSLVAPAAEQATRAMSGLTKQLTEYLHTLDKIGEKPVITGLEGARQKIAAAQPTAEAFKDLVDASLKRLEIPPLPEQIRAGGPSATERASIGRTLDRERQLTTAREIAYFDQRDAAIRDLLSAQREELDLKTQLAQMEKQHGDLAQRRYQVELASISAQQRALPAQYALQDTERAVERARLVLGIRGISADDRMAARAQIRDLTRNVLPGQRLGAFDAETGVLGAQRGAAAFDLSARLTAIGMEQAVSRQEAVVDAAANRTAEAMSRLEDIVKTMSDRQQRPVTVRLEVVGPDGQVTYEELIEATGQAQMPPVIRVSGVRR